MKLILLTSTLLLSTWIIIAQLLLWEVASAHLETCNCNEIRSIIDSYIQLAMARLENKFTREINSAVNEINKTNSAKLSSLENGLTGMLYDMKNNLTSSLEKFLKQIGEQLNYHPPPPMPSPDGSEDSPAESCKAFFDADPDSPSDYYWIKATSNSSAVRVYCRWMPVVET